MDLLVKVGELVDKLFDEDEEMMKSWVSTPASDSDPNKDTQQDVTSSLLEAATQLRWDVLIKVMWPARLSVRSIYQPIPLSAARAREYVLYLNQIYLGSFKFFVM